MATYIWCCSQSDLPTSSGPVQIFADNPLMCEQFSWSDANRPGNAPELAANILANTLYDSRPWYELFALTSWLPEFTRDHECIL